MRWLRPLILAVALAVGAVEYPTTSARKRARTGLDGLAWTHPQGSPAQHGHDLRHDLRSEDARVAAFQSATFDAVTGTLTWFDDDYAYN